MRLKFKLVKAPEPEPPPPVKKKKRKQGGKGVPFLPGNTYGPRRQKSLEPKKPRMSIFATDAEWEELGVRAQELEISKMRLVHQLVFPARKK